MKAKLSYRNIKTTPRQINIIQDVTSACQAPDPPPIGLFLTQHRNKSLK